MGCVYCGGDHDNKGWHVGVDGKFVWHPAPTLDPNGPKPEAWFYQGMACKDPLPADSHDCECVEEYGMPCGPCREKTDDDWWNYV